MAENTNKISQIQVGTTTYDICDATVRNSVSNLHDQIFGISINEALFAVDVFTNYSGTGAVSSGQTKDVICRVIKGDTSQDIKKYIDNGYMQLGIVGISMLNSNFSLIGFANRGYSDDGSGYGGRIFYKNTSTSNQTINASTVSCRILF